MVNYISKIVATAMISGFSLCANAQLSQSSYDFIGQFQPIDENMQLATDTRGSRNSSSAQSSSSGSTNRGSGNLNRNVNTGRPLNGDNSGERPSRPSRDNAPHHTPHHHHNAIDYPTTTTEYEYVYEDNGYASSSYAGNSIEEIEHPTERHILTFTFGPNLSYRDIESPDRTYKTNTPKFGYVGGLRYDLGLGTHGLYMSTGAEYEYIRYKNYFDEYNILYSSKRMISIPLMFGWRIGDNECIGGIGLGPRFHYGLDGKCRETYDWASGYDDPNAEHGVFRHPAYGGKYGQSRFCADFAAELYLYADRLFLAYTISAGFSECEPRELYGELVEHFSSRVSHSLKFGVRIF